MEKFLCEDKAIKSVVDPVSIATAKTGGRVKMVNAKRTTFIVDVGAGTSTTAHSFILKQHDAESSGNSKDLAVAHPYYHKVDDADSFTKVDVDTATATYDLHSLLSDDKGLAVFEVLSEDLDSENGFKWVSLDIVAANGTQVGSVLAVVDHEFKPAYAQEV
jgi:hypothetical protein